MPSALKKLSLGLVVVIAVLIIILVGQIRDARIISTKAQQIPLISPVAVSIPISSGDFILGNPGAPLTVVAFLDFADKRSLEFYRTISALVTKNPTKIRFFVKHYPGQAFFSNPLLIHEAAYCAGQQGKFWHYVDAIAASKRTLRQSQLTALAESNQLSLKAWEACLSAETTLAIMQTDNQTAQSLGLPAAPVVFINNKLLNPEEKVDLTQLLTSFLAPSV